MPLSQKKKLSNQTLSARGDDISLKIAKTLKEDSWLWTLMNLAWTAGPVTFLALYGGYYFSHGESPSFTSILYFTVYTLISGVLAIIVQTIRRVFYTPKINAAQKQLVDVTEQLFTLYFAARNVLIHSYPEEERAIIASWWILRNNTLSEEVLEQTVFDLTQSQRLATSIKKIEFYRKQGMLCLAQSEYEEIKDELNDATEHLNEKFPGIVELLKNRCQHGAPTLRGGIIRPSGFLERAFSSEDHEANNILTPDDMLTIIILCIELLSGRTILSLHPVLQGHSKLEASSEEFQELLSDFRLLRRKRNGRMRALIEEINLLLPQESLATVGTKSQELLTLMESTFSALKEEYKPIGSSLLQTTFSKITRPRWPTPNTKKTLEDQELSIQFNHMVKIYQELLQINKKLNLTYRKLLRSEATYIKHWSAYGGKKSEWEIHTNNNKEAPSIEIQEHLITLSDKQKLSLANDISVLLTDISLRKGSLRGYVHSKEGNTLMTMDDYKTCAIDLVNLLDDLLNISEPEEQAAVEGSRSANLGTIERTLPTKTKIGWASMLVEEIEHSATESANRLAKYMATYLNVTLNEDMIDYLTEQYQADEEYLKRLQQAAPKLSLQHTCQQFYADLLVFHPSWEQTLKDISHRYQ